MLSTIKFWFVKDGLPKTKLHCLHTSCKICIAVAGKAMLGLYVMLVLYISFTASISIVSPFATGEVTVKVPSLIRSVVPFGNSASVYSVMRA